MTSHFYLTRIMPIGLFMALTLFFGNVVYLYLSVSFIQMLKVCGSQQLGVTVLHRTGVQLLVTGKSSAWNRTSERSMLPVEQTSVCTGQPSILHLIGASECNLVGHPGWQPGRAKVPSTLRCSVPMHCANLAHINMRPACMFIPGACRHSRLLSPWWRCSARRWRPPPSASSRPCAS